MYILQNEFSTNFKNFILTIQEFGLFNTLLYRSLSIYYFLSQKRDNETDALIQNFKL